MIQAYLNIIPLEFYMIYVMRKIYVSSNHCDILVQQCDCITSVFLSKVNNSSPGNQNKHDNIRVYKFLKLIYFVSFILNKWVQEEN